MPIRVKYRRGVCGILRSADGRILLGERTKEKNQWQLPQGGIDSGETPLQALHREIAEEVGVSGLSVIRQTTEFVSYLWPRRLVGDSKYGGQKHIYFLLDASGIDIRTLVASPEFCAFEWYTVEETLERVVEWRRNAYISAFHELGLKER